MVKEKYIRMVKSTVKPYAKNGRAKFFLFGSSVKRERFGDLDLGVVGRISRDEIGELKELFKDSDLPYFVDVVDFNKVTKRFRDNVLNNDVLWIKT
jgi:hypothetical protein